MSKTKQTKRVTRRRRDTLRTMPGTLPGAFFVLDHADTIVYANASAQAMLGAPPKALCENNFWHCAPHLVSPVLYQAVRKTKQTRALTDVQYVSPINQNWLHVHLAPMVGGLTLQFHEASAPARPQKVFPQGEHLCIDDLDGLQIRTAVLTPEGIVLALDAISLNNAQVRCEKVIGQPLAETPWWSLSSAAQEQLRAAIARASTGETVRFESMFHPREGMDLHLEVAITPHMDVDHYVAYLVMTGIDITARKRSEAAIHTLIDAIPQLVWTGRPDGNIDYCNQRWRDYTGMSTEQAQGNGWMQCIHPEDRQRVLAVWQRAVQTSQPCEAEQRLRQGTTGAYRWFLMQATPYKDAQGTILAYIGTCTDIEEQKRAEQQLKESRENLRVLAETVPQLVWTTSPDGWVEYWNQRWYDYSGSSPAQALGHRWSQFVHPDDAQRTLKIWHHACASGEPYEIEYRLKDGQTGAYRWFLTRGVPVRDEGGQIVKWFGTGTDIENQKRTEEALHQSQERIRALIDSNIIGIISVEMEGEVLADANEAFLRMTGYTREEVQNRTLSRVKITSPEQAPLFERSIQELTARGQRMPFETELVCQDGSRLPVLVGGVIFQEQPRQMVVFVLDNSARKELEQRKDDFISMASHELKTPLTAFKMQTSLLRRQLARQGILQAAPALSSMEAQLNKVIRLVGELLDVSKIQAGRLEYAQEPVDPDALLREIAETMQHTNPSRTLVVRGAAQTCLIGDRDRLGQVFTNLISNAFKYSPDAETVEIDLATSEDVVMVRVRDYGLGIPREQRDKIFDRFYRVADPKRKAIPGLGIGLYIVAEIVKHHGGTITVDSAVGKGSTFTVTLPRTRDACAVDARGGRVN